jgi:probable F420-dependent oxidoreductase
VRLGEYGIWTSYRAIGEENAPEAAALVEELGYGTFWLGGSPRLPSLRPLLEGSERLVVGTAIVNIWAYDPAQLAAEYAELAADFADRLIVGVGVGHPEATGEYSKPLSAMREFLDGLDGAERPIPPESRCLAALAPKMLALSAERARGAIPYFIPVEHTRAARQQLGSGPLLAPEVAYVIDEDAERARAVGREYAAIYLGLSNYTNNLLNHGFEQADIRDGGSDRLIDAVIPHGSVEQVAAAVRAHREAGADHVCVQAVGEGGVPREQWAALADALIG